MNKEVLKIEKQISTLQNKIQQLSGNYLTNTRKRQAEQRERDRKKDAYRARQQFLEYLLSKAQDGTMTPFEKMLVTGTFYEDMRCLLVCLNHYGDDFQYPQRDEAQISRLKKAGISTLEQLRSSLDSYAELMKQAVTPPDKNAERLRDLIFNAKMQQSGDIQFTPPELARQVVDIANPSPGNRILEPEAGIGSLADEIRKVTDNIDCIERMYSFREILQLKKYNLIGDDLMEAVPKAVYDAVVMNPPFSQECEHIQKAFEFVRPGGTLTAVCSNRITWKQQKSYALFRDWLEQYPYSIDNPVNCKFEMTGMQTIILHIEKAA